MGNIFIRIRYTMLFCPFTWVVWYLNNLFYFDQIFWNCLTFNIARDTLFVGKYCRYTCSRSRHNWKTWIVFSNIYFFGVFYFGTFSDKLADEIDLGLFTVFTVYSVSVLLVYLDSSYAFPLSFLLLLDLSIFPLDACDFFVLLTVSIFFFSIGIVMDSFTTLSFFHVINPFFGFFL